MNLTDLEIHHDCAVSSLQNGKSTGMDSIAAEVLKIPALRHIIINILNRAFESGAAPDLRKSLYMVPVPKKGDLTLCTNYRGILLMSITAKLYKQAATFPDPLGSRKCVT